MRTFLFLFSLCMAITAFAQDDSSWEVNHYEHTRTFVEEGYTYQCDVKYGYVTLYNAANQWTYADQIDNRTGKLYTSNLGENDVFEMSDETAKAIIRIVNQSFSQEEARRITDNGFMLTLFFSPVTGDLAEVCFNFSIFRDSARIPISYYRDIELQLKEQVHVKVLEGGKHLTYLMTCVTLAPEGRLSVMQP
ncbi:MAG: DUF5043 domain-containing protein [Candidatus Bacteroides intestinipullorum]|uniref:DUF5043 domain-containing protein n=1 Tax=Candidatus Bacteroides intestinipullorum TaxID=2838471 RepID=A0A9E2KIC5_9BACE|nr:DUF5043 domain-containing protein [Candidatus Bacteroides intestinipullorum]